MNEAAGAELARRQVRQHLVHVHVGLRARAGLPDGEREFRAVAAGQHLVGGRRDGLRHLGGQAAEVGIHPGAGALYLGEGEDEFLRHALA